MADEEPWILSGDGFLNADVDSKSVICHPNLNVILLVTKSNELIVIDVNSGSVLQRSSLSAKWQGDVQGIYLSGTDKVLLTDGSAVGVRSDYNGVLLLDTILQPPVQKSDQVVKLELLHTEAVLLQRCLKQVELRGVYQTCDVLQELNNRTKEGQVNPRKTIKSQKWSTVCLELPHSSLKAVCSGLVNELKRQNQHLPVLPLASALNERLNSLLPSLALDNVGTTAERNLMHSEAARRETFSKWPHMNYKWALPDQMAQAGFFHQPNSAGDDRAMCFTCIVCLVCWEPTDEPWSEHERHSPSCPFVKGEYTQNVPLSVTYATAPAAPLSSTPSDEAEEPQADQVMLGTSSAVDLAITFSSSGSVNVWNVKRQLKSEATIVVTGGEQVLLQRRLQHQDLYQFKQKLKPNKSQRTDGNPDVDQIQDPKPDRDQSDCDLYADVPKPPREAWLRADVNSESENAETSPLDSASDGFVPKENQLEVSAASAVSGCHPRRDCFQLQPVAVVGVELFPICYKCPRKDPPTWGGTCDVVRLMNDANQASNCEIGSLDIMKVSQDPSLACSSSHQEQLRQSSSYLIVYDLYPSLSMDDCDDDDGGNSGGSYGSISNSGSGAGTSVGVAAGAGVSGPGSGSGSGSNSGSGKKIDKSVTTQAGGNVKKYVSGTGTSASSSSGTRQENMYQDLFLPKFLYGPPVVQDGEGSVIITGGPDPLDGLDFSPPNSVFSAPDYTLNMLQVTLGNSNPGTIINHMKKLTAKKCMSALPPIISQESPKSKQFEPIAVQCIPVRAGYKIHSIHPTKDGGHILVVLVWKYCGDAMCDDGSAMDVDGDEEELKAPVPLSILLLYALDVSSEVVRIHEDPVQECELTKPGETPEEVSLLPLLERDEREESDETEPGRDLGSQSIGLATLVCVDGTLKVLDLSTLSIVAEAVPSSGSRFVSATFCNNLERICACTESGSLHFFPLRWNEMDALTHIPGTPNALSSFSSSMNVPPEFPSHFSELLVNGSLGISELRQLLELTLSENLTPCYTATVPPCWSEIMQAQKQRKHPQHLQQGDDAQHTRTWRLQRDVTTWDEHVFEITLPKSCTIGHVCFKFSFQSTCSPPPNIQVTLLKQNVSGIGHKHPASLAVDSKVDFGIGGFKESVDNPVMSEEYLRAHNAEILCGPVNLAQYLDLSEQGGSLTLTSPKLMQTRSRTLLVHMKALSVDLQSQVSFQAEEKMQKKARPESAAGCSSSSNMSSAMSSAMSTSCPLTKQSFFISNSPAFSNPGKKFDVGAPSTSKKSEIFLGCDWMQEVSIAIRRTRQTLVPFERNQRQAMLESNSFIERLVGVVCLVGPDKTRPAQSLALDVLCWVISVRLSPHCSGGLDLGDTKLQQQQVEVGQIVKSHMRDLIHHCFILGTRSVAHKCLKFILVCIKGIQNVSEAEGLALEKSVLEGLMHWLPSIGATKSAGSLRWFLLLLMRVSPLDSDGVIGRECVFLLTLVAGELSNRTNPYHLLLRSRFGLYGTPFDPELFDVDPPVSGKSTSVPLTYAQVVQGDSGLTPSSTNVGGSGIGGDSLDLRELLSVPDKSTNPPENVTTGCASSTACSNTTSMRLKGLASNHYMKGLLEVEPLHYTCHAASDGTKLEKIEPGCGCTIPVGNFITVGTSGTKKAADGDFMCFCLGKELPEDKWEEISDKMLHAALMETSRLSSIYKGEQVKPHGMLSQEGESSSASSQQSSTNSSPWLPQYTTNEKLPSPLSSQHQPVHKPDCEAKATFEEDHEMPSCSTKIPDEKKSEDLPALNVPWQQLLVPPPQQTVVIERMHSGARRFVVLDFGAPVMLTDMIVPACCDLVLLSVDVWLCSEEQDGQRLVVASDIATKALVLSDLQPPPICRYLKITTIGRYGMTTTKCKIPIGSFFGHTMILPGECGPENSLIPTLSESNLRAQISVLGSLLEDIHCRYALACSRLRELLSPFLQAETPNAAHMYCYLQKARDLDRQMSFNLDTTNQKVFSAYQECITFQHQLNVVRSVMARLEAACSPGAELPVQDLNCHQHFVKASTDKLRVLGEGLLDVLLYLGSMPLYSFSSQEFSCLDRSVCENLFYWLCVGQDTRMQLSSATLLVRLCGSQPWWGQFLAETVANLFSSNNSTVFPQDRVFIILAYLGRKSLTLTSARMPVLESVLGMLGNLLQPLSSGSDGQPLRSSTDLSLVGWVLLFVSQCLDIGSGSRDEECGDKPALNQGQQNRWDFIQGEVAMQKRAAAGGGRNRANILRTKRILVKQQLSSAQDSVEAMKKEHIYDPFIGPVLKAKSKPQEMYIKKVLKHPTSVHLKGALRAIEGGKRGWGGGRRIVGGASSGSGGSGAAADAELPAEGREGAVQLTLPQAECLPVARGLVALVLHMDFTCNIDMFLVACKVLARIVVCSRPALPLTDLVSPDQLLKLVRMAVWQDPHQSSWGGPWAAHAITCLLQDVLDGVRAAAASPPTPTAASAASAGREASPADDANVSPGPSKAGGSSSSSSSSSSQRAGKAKGKAKAGSLSPPQPSSANSPAAGPSSASSEFSISEPLIQIQDAPMEVLLTPGVSPFLGQSGSKGGFSGKLKTSWAKAVTGSSSFAELLNYITDNGEPNLDGTEDMVAEDCPDAAVSQPGGSGSGKGNGIVALESDDSELDDFLDDILEHGRNLMRKGSSSRSTIVATSKAGCISTAMDARLDFAVDCHAEVLIRRLTMLGAFNLPHSVNAVFPQPVDLEKPPSSPGVWPLPENEPTASHNMLIDCFNRIFCELQLQGSWTSLEHVFQLWLTLNSESSFDPSVHHQFDPSSCPTIGLSPEAVSSLLSALKNQPEMSVRTWCLAFQCLTQVSNTPCVDAVARWGARAANGMTSVISADSQFLPVLLRFLSGTGLSSQNSDVGPSVCGAMRDLLVRLMVRTDSRPKKPSKKMSNQLLHLANQLISSHGAISGHRGPLDAQFAFFNLLLGFNFSTTNIDTLVIMNYLESVGMVVHTFIMTSEKVRRRSVSEANQSSSMCFGGLLSHVIGGEAKALKGSSWDNLLCAILKLACMIVQNPLKREIPTSPGSPASGASSSDSAQTGPADMCQTDEHKVKTMESGSGNAPVIPRTPCVVDLLLQHQLTMARLLSALAGCVGSPLAVLLGTSGERDASEPRALSSTLSGEPISVGDGIFHLLHILCRKVSSPQLLLRPLFDFLVSVREGSSVVPGQSSGVLQLSEPLLWFIMKALDSPETLSLFNDMGGIKVVCENLLHCSQKLVSSHPSLVSVVMQHLSRVPPSQQNISKKIAAPQESYEGLQNFAPLASISSSSTTAQPADVLIQSFPSHRRARTPAWSYHFYPDELYMDLTLRLPCAVLLKEIQLQPHLTSLATCPSAVGLEVSKDGSSPLIPLCSPLPTSGMTFVRLTLDRPEIVTCVLLRLYRPHDSASIGLSQVRLLGSTTFGETAYRTMNWDVPEEEHLTKTSLGWLRLLHHCLVVTKNHPELRNSVVASAAGLAGLLDACAGLLLIPAPAPPLLTTALEHVLLLLGLHSQELGLKLMQDLLRSSLHSQFSMSPPMGADSVVDLLFLLGTERDSHAHARVATMLSWLRETAAAALEPHPGTSKGAPPQHAAPFAFASDIPASAACIHSVAAVLWRLHAAPGGEGASGAAHDLAGLFSTRLFMDVYRWTLLLPVKSGVKAALDSVLCAMCYIQPDLFPALLRTIGAVAPDHGAASMGDMDDMKGMDDEEEEAGGITDDRKQLDAWSSNIHLSEGQLMTIAMVSQSPPAVKHLLESGLLSFLSSSLLEFCFNEQEKEYLPHKGDAVPPPQSAMTDADKAASDEEDNSLLSVNTMASILKLFAELCYEGQLRNWFGSPEGSVFWLPLLRLLCFRSSKQTSGLQPQSQAYGELETATIQFLSRVTSLHPENQEQLARVLCDVISQQETRHHNVSFLHGISGFARRLVLQLLLESEKIRVLVNSEVPLQRPDGAGTAVGLRHPSHGVGHRCQVVIVSHYTTCAELIKLVVGNSALGPLLGEKPNPDPSLGATAGPSGSTAKREFRTFKEFEYLCFYDPLFAAGFTAKDKRSKEAKNAATRGPYAKKTRISDSSSGNSLPASLGLAPERWLEQPQLQTGVPLPGTATLGQVLMALQERGVSLCSASFEVNVKQTTSVPKDNSTGGSNPLTNLVTCPTPLEVFAAHGGLALLAEHLPLVYPETLRYSAQDKPQPTVSSPDAMDSDWVKVDGSNIDLYDELDDSSPLVGSSSHNTPRPSSTSLVPTSVPPHSLAAFGLFLRLPGYAEILLRDPKKAQCLLRLALGVSDDGEGGDILSLPLAPSLPTLPFQNLRLLLDGAPLHTDDGELLRRTALDTGAVHLVLACLSVFTRQQQEMSLPGVQHELVIAATRATVTAGQQGGAGASSGAARDGVGGGRSAGLGGKAPSSSDDKSQLYWAKGTGFGTGSTTQCWNVEQALMRQRGEEEHVTVLLQAVASFLNPRDAVPRRFHRDGAASDDADSDSDTEAGPGGADGASARPPHASQSRLPAQLSPLLQKSCLLPAVCSYLRNDSVLDMARHIPLYRAVLQVLRALAVCQQLAALLLPADRRGHGRPGSSSRAAGSGASSLSAVCLLNKMKGCVDTYASRLRVSRTKGSRKGGPSPGGGSGAAGSGGPGGGGGSSSSSRLPNKFVEDWEQDEGLAQLIGDIQHTASMVQIATDRLVVDDDSEASGRGPNASGSAQLEYPIKRTLEERYLEVMQKLQFDTFEMISENSEGGYQFAVSYHFESNLRSAGERSHPTRVKRLAQETVTLSTSLPLSYSSSVYVRCDADRLDIMKVLITGPADTPYANGCFEFDVYFPPDYPNSPMLINMETTGHRTIRFNPNLYNDGKVCLSVLNTWHGRPEEKWNAQTSSFLQVLVSIQSLILVPEPYFNEPGYERSRGTPSGNQSSKEYNANICQASVKWAMLEQVRNPCPCFREVIHTHFWFKKREIIKQIEQWIADMENQGNDRRNGRTISLNTIALKRHFKQLREELNKLKPPLGLEDLAGQLEAEDSATPTNNAASPATASASSASGSSASAASATPTHMPTPVAGPSQQAGPSAPFEQSDVDTDMEMEKIVSKVCE